MRDYILLFVNGQQHRVGGNDVFLSLTDFLRYRLRLVGTKLVCSEGDCGACSVLIGQLTDGRYRYQVVDSCIQFVFQLDGCHVVTVEGLKRDERLTPVQEAMIQCHGSQCGFCTPGFVVSMTALSASKRQLTRSELRDGLIGNLCRCTGYEPIIEAGMSIPCDQLQQISELYPDAAMRGVTEPIASQAIGVRVGENGSARSVHSPVNLRGALDFLADNPKATIVAGATDVGVQLNKGLISPDVLLDLNRVSELRGIEVTEDSLIAGAGASWTQLEQVVEPHVPEFHHIVTLFGAPQIRNVGTIGGNLANASPIADSLPFLYVSEAEVELDGPDGPRRVNINDFYLGYKQLAMRPGELIARVHIPLPSNDSLLRLHKVSRRRDLDIASFTAALLIEVEDGSIRSAAVAFGAVGPTVIRARRTETFLIGRPFTEQVMCEAGDVALEEISPISDVRGKDSFRRQLTRNVLVRFFHETNAG